MVPPLVVIIAVFLFHGCCEAKGTHDPEKFLEEAGQIYTTIFHKYNSRVRPPDDYPSKVKVKVQATLLHIRRLEVLKQELETVLDLEITWDDKRLAWYAYQVYNITAGVDQVWSPSLVYLNSAVPPSPLFVPKVTINYEGVITWYRQDVVTTVCHTQPRSPSQICLITLGFTSRHADEQFDNTTAFELSSDFSNHQWDVLGNGIDMESSQKIHLELELAQLDPKADRLEDRNETDASEEWNEEASDTASYLLANFPATRLLPALLLCSCLLLCRDLY